MKFLTSLFATPERRFAAAIAGLLLARLVALIIGHPELGPDEGQYWFWSKTPAFGYFSKPPVVAWSIAATTALFGDAEWAVRLSAPLYQAGAASFIFLLARRLSNGETAFWAGVSWLTLPGVFLSSALVTTDAPLIFFWCVALFLFFVLTDDARPRRPLLVAAMLGAAIGAGMMSKYAMSYFVLGAGLALLLSPARRQRLSWRAALTTAAVAGAVIAPNMAWNAANDFQTISHTAANADWGGAIGHPDRLIKFLLDQFGVVGPIMLGLIVVAATRRGETNEARRTLLAFAIPALAVVSAQAFISRAHGNWAAVSYPSAIILATLFAAHSARAMLAIRASVLLHLVVGGGFLLAFASWPFAEAVGATAAFKRLTGWERQGAEIAAQSASYDAIMTDDREITGELVYYARHGAPIVAWNPNAKIDNHFEAFCAFDPTRDRRVLYVTTYADALPVEGLFETRAPKGTIDADLPKGRTRRLYLFELSNFKDASG